MKIRFGNERGVVVVFVAICMSLFLGLAAFSVDTWHLMVSRNELQNAADAGALAGARFLYNSDGTAVNAGANQIARDAAVANFSDTSPVEVNWTGGNEGDVQRGHWSFATRTFTPNPSLEPVELWDRTTAELDLDPDFINAVRVVTRRQNTPIRAFFARLLGHDSFQMDVDAVAYIGFVGTLRPGDVDQPIAICEDSITLPSGEYSCNVGRMINSGQNTATSETGGWTSFNQDNPCSGGTNAQEVRSLVDCDGDDGGTNPHEIVLGKEIATNGGEIQSAFNQLITCWENATGRSEPWNLTLPVVSCPGNNVGTCEEVRGAVNLNVLWITGSGEDSDYSEAPRQMGNWSNDNSDGQVRWDDFVDSFDLRNVDGSPAPYAKKSIYFLPDCTEHELAGVTGGENYGILARIPVLVE